MAQLSQIQKEIQIMDKHGMYIIVSVLMWAVLMTLIAVVHYIVERYLR